MNRKILIALLSFLLVSDQQGFALPPNKGNYNKDGSCFLNSTIEALFHLQPLRDFLEKANTKKYYPEDSTPNELIKQINSMAKNTDIIDPEPFRKNVTTAERYQGNNQILTLGKGQRDAKEFLDHIINCLGSETIDQDEAKKTLIAPFDEKIRNLVNNGFFSNTKPTQNYDKIYLEKRLKKILKNKKRESLKQSLYKSLVEKNKKLFNKSLKDLLSLEPDNDTYKLLNQILQAGTSLDTLIEKIIACIQRSTTRNTLPNESRKKISDDPFIQGDTLDNLANTTRKTKEYLYDKFAALAIDYSKQLEVDWIKQEEIIKETDWSKALEKLNKVEKFKHELKKLYDAIVLETGDHGNFDNVIKSKEANLDKTRLPEILTIQLPFYNEEFNKTGNTYTITKTIALNESLKKVEYRLTAVIVHLGDSLDSGHYWTYARYWQDKNWYQYNDCGLKADNLDKETLNNILRPGTAYETPYLLFYVRNDYTTPSENSLAKQLKELKEKLKMLKSKLSKLTNSLEQLKQNLGR